MKFLVTTDSTNEVLAIVHVALASISGIIIQMSYI